MLIDPLADQSFQPCPLYQAPSPAHLSSSTEPDEEMMSKQRIALVGGAGRPGTLTGNVRLDKADAQSGLLIRPGSRQGLRPS
jgi:hypothetical protein